LRQEAQYELLNRETNDRIISAIWKLVTSSSLELESRVAALYTYAQISQENGIDNLIKATQDSDIQEFAIRALTDRKGWIDSVPVEILLTGLQSSNPRVQPASIIALRRSGNKEAIPALLDISVPASFRAPDLGQEGPHATPNSGIVIPHLAVKALVDLDAAKESIEALEDPDRRDLALWVLRYFHDHGAVEKLIMLYSETNDLATREKFLHALARIYHKEAPYDATWWWGTRPDSHGPYYKTEDWEGTSVIESFF